jgi:ATP-binding cassette subfamily B (MDR/TAP) protein 1
MLASTPLQAYLFGRLISSFAYWGDQLRTSTSFLCTMLLVVAIGLGFCYYSLGWISNHLSAVCSLLTIHKLLLY